MTQQINLLDPRFRQRKKHFSAATLALALALLLALSVGLQSLYARQNRALQATLSDTDRRVATLREQLVRFSNEYSAQGRSTALADETARVEERLRARRELLAGMRSGGGGGNVEGFSPYLAALARQTMNGVWLTGIEIGGKSGDLVLKGRVLDSDLVPAYIGQLNKEEPFAGRSITELRLTAKTGKATSGPARYVEFSLSIPLRKDAS
ncbi:MAG: hypothetical protein A3G81_01780 [Betaproteobacteria bacterium RIFCSPLOWO2_12_FULL_65_14]|nr:MAG: hypothetical protein A3G81_01780 [Betaproteobacteria bacterium RIFCSPLOWO2_12_FULL_65_14]